MFVGSEDCYRPSENVCVCVCIHVYKCIQVCIDEYICSCDQKIIVVLRKMRLSGVRIQFRLSNSNKKEENKRITSLRKMHATMQGAHLILIINLEKTSKNIIISAHDTKQNKANAYTHTRTCIKT